MGRRGPSRDEPDEPDGTIVRRVVAGDVDGFERLVDRHAPRVRRLVARNVPLNAAAEVAHDAFVAAYLALPSYVDVQPFEHWLTRIVLRACADFWRARRRDDQLRSPDVDAQDASAPPPPNSDERELCEWALGKLERADREVLVLFYFEGLSVKECAAVLAWSETKVKVRAHRARIALRRLLERASPERGEVSS